jgi:hypothetical protein
MIHVQFLKKGAPFGFAYMAGQTGSILDFKQAKELESLGILKIIDPPSDLPEDIPGRKFMIEAGYYSINDLKKVEDFTEIPGITKTINKRIKEYIAAQ